MNQHRDDNEGPTLDIAIVGMAGRFPGANDIDTFWKNLSEGVESIRRIDDAELELLGVSEAERDDPHYVKVSAALDGQELFDAAFFGIIPSEAEIMDPQHRIFLECCWHALEDAAVCPAQNAAAIGVFAGATTNTYLLYNLLASPEKLRALDAVQIDIASSGDFLSTRIAHKLDLRGPAFSIQSACSTSLVAVHVACQSLLNEECDVALAGGVCINVKHREGYRHAPGSIVTPDGHCRAFDARADGTVFGSGVGVVVLKRLADAIADGDSIRAIIKGSAINNDGALKVGFTAPSVEGQAAVIREALAASGVDPRTIGVIEAHGTGTKLGDPIEVRAIERAFRDKRSPISNQSPRWLGSLKTNVGHLGSAAGVAGLIKAALTLEHRQIPPTLHFEVPNPELDIEATPFRVNSKLMDWVAPLEGPRRAGVSSFGVGGTNAHVILEEAVAAAPSGPTRTAQLIVLSAKTRPALAKATKNLVQHIEAHPEQDLADIAYTLQVGRTALTERRVLVCRGRDDALSVLSAEDSGRLVTITPRTQRQPVVFLFPGQGSQYVGMARDLYATEMVFREQLDRCAEFLAPEIGLDLRKILFSSDNHDLSAAGLLESTAIAQPALFAVEYALAQMWMAWGVKPAAMLGHSVGEYVAACLAGVFSLRDALNLIAARGKLMQSMPVGAMTSVLLASDELMSFLPQTITIAAINGPAISVISGPTEEIAAFETELQRRNVIIQRLHTARAFHSSMMDPIVKTFAERVRSVKLSPPQIPFISNRTGVAINAQQAVDPMYWASHLREPVLFSAGLRALVENRSAALLEVGPGVTLTRLSRAQIPIEYVAISTTRHPHDQTSDVDVLLGAVGRLWAHGVDIDWSAFSATENRRRLHLPTYPFERQRYWIDARQVNGPSHTTVAPPVATNQSPQSKADVHERPCVSTHYVEPETDLERAIAKIWCEALGFRSIGIDDNFFEMGGHSLLAVQLHSEIERSLHVEFPIANLYQRPTIRTLASLISPDKVEKNALARSDKLAQRKEDIKRRNERLARKR